MYVQFALARTHVRLAQSHVYRPRHYQNTLALRRPAMITRQRQSCARSSLFYRRIVQLTPKNVARGSIGNIHQRTRQRGLIPNVRRHNPSHVARLIGNCLRYRHEHGHNDARTAIYRENIAHATVVQVDLLRYHRGVLAHTLPYRNRNRNPAISLLTHD